MVRIIEVEETVKVRHQIVVDVYNEDQMHDALDVVEGTNITCIDEYVDAVAGIIPVVGFNEGYVIEVENIDYYDSYECEGDEY